MLLQREDLKKAKRVVVKVGSSTITYTNGKRNYFRIDRLARELSDLQNQGKEMILVSSGAVAVGVDRLGLPEKPKTIPGKQACAAVGQGLLMHSLPNTARLSLKCSLRARKCSIVIATPMPAILLWSSLIGA